MKVNNKFSIFLIGVFLLNIAAIGMISNAAADNTPMIPDYEPMDIDVKLFNQGLMSISTPILPDGEVEGDSGTDDGSLEAMVGDMKYMLSYDGIYGLYIDVYVLMAVGDITEIWVQLDRSYPDGDPRAYPEITQDQIDYLLGEFENNIYPIDTEYFGTPDYYDGFDAPLASMLGLPEDYYYSPEGKNMIMVSNIRDDSYYDYTYPSYIAGFYWNTYEYYFGRNIINIDSHDWLNRVGPDVPRPFLYEGTIAHEYQHLIHADYNPGDATFMNEGCSMYAEPLCGYGYSFSQIESYLTTPDNSLTIWGDQGDRNILADYGVALLWTVYLSDHYGGAELISHFVQAGIPGIEGINAALEFFGYTETFDDIYHDWRIANLIHSGTGKYNYLSIDLLEAENGLRVYEIESPEFFSGIDFGTTVSLYGDDTGIAKLGSYGSDYIRVSNNDRNHLLDLFLFDGDDTAEYGWIETEDGWYSGAETLYDVSLIANAFVDPTNPTLSLTSAWDIEDYWDFGFIQVSTDDGLTWTSLANEYTTDIYDESAHPDIVANLPGITGFSDGIITMNFDLTAYAGQDIMISFRYMTDWGTEYEGWTIESASVSGEELVLTNVEPEADFLVSVVSVYEDRHGNEYYYIQDLCLNDNIELGMGITTATEYYFIISPLMEKGMVDYSFDIYSIGFRNQHKYRCYE